MEIERKIEMQENYENSFACVEEGRVGGEQKKIDSLRGQRIWVIYDRQHFLTIQLIPD